MSNERIRELELAMSDVNTRLAQALIRLEDAINNLLDDDYGETSVSNALGAKKYIHNAIVCCCG